MDTLTKIMNAAVELFRRYGFKTITMDDVARHAGVSKKTLYQHFANKQEVINESVTWYKNHLFELCQQIFDSSGNAIEAMVGLMSLMEQTFRQMNPIAMMELQRYYPEGHQRFRETLLTQDVEVIRKNIERGIEEGLYREEINADLMAKIYIETSVSLCVSPVLLNDRYDLHVVNKELMEHFLYGLMTPKGIKLYTKYKKTYLKQVVKI